MNVKPDKASGRLKRAALTFVVAISVLILIGVGVTLQRYRNVSNVQTLICKAVRTNNDILYDLLIQAQRETIKSIREGRTPGTVKQARTFYQPTIARIDSVRCLPGR